MSPRPAIDHIRRPQILRAAAEVITERGLAATRIADVADRAGTSAPAVIYWFKTRERLLTEALIADEDTFAEELDARLAELPGAPARMRFLIEASTSDGDLSLWIELWARSLHDAEAAAERQRLDDAWRGRIAAIVAAGQQSGEFSAEIEPEEAALRIATLIDGLSVQVTLGDTAVSEERMRRICLDFAAMQLGADLTAGEGAGEAVA
ncbi:MAG: TetR family transcriptional regulator C-terminal domain-containing protein [Solirubrobacterales bacterium]